MRRRRRKSSNRHRIIYIRIKNEINSHDFSPFIFGYETHAFNCKLNFNLNESKNARHTSENKEEEAEEQKWKKENSTSTTTQKI